VTLQYPRSTSATEAAAFSSSFEVSDNPLGESPKYSLKIAAFTGGKNVSSARFRVRQYIQPAKNFGINLTEYWPLLSAYPPRRKLLRPAWFAATAGERLVHLAAARSCDGLLFQKELISTLPTLEGFGRRPSLVDIDDSIHLFRGGWAARKLAAIADVVVVGNDWLAEVWRRWAHEVEVLPTAIDTERYPLCPMPDGPVIGWIGIGSNLHYLMGIAPALEAVVHRFPGTKIAVCSDVRPKLPNLPVSYVPWSPDVEEPFLASISIGIMPLTNGPWEQGKCAFKMLQYMSSGRPCVVSPAFMNANILGQAQVGLSAVSIDDWTNALSDLLADRDEAQRMGKAGRKLAVEAYSVEALAPRFAAQLRRLA
jgi:glycosyltransferase involved in cell wall biosynthesis